MRHAGKGDALLIAMNCINKRDASPRAMGASHNVNFISELRLTE
jgi:hypothetical protein